MRLGLRVGFWLTMFCCLFLAGCKVTKSVSDAGTVFHPPLHESLGIVAVGVVMLWIGITFRKSRFETPLALTVGGLVLIFVLAPLFYTDRVVVNNQGFELPPPIIHPWSAGQKVEFDNVTSVRVTREETIGRNPRKILVLYFKRKSGGVVRYPLEDGVWFMAAKMIIKEIQRKGIPIIMPK